MYFVYKLTSASSDWTKRAPLGPHSQGETTMSGYENVVVNLVAFLLRDKEGYLFPAGEILDGPIQCFRKALDSLHPNDLTIPMTALNALLVALWHRHWPEATGPTVHDPTFCWLVLSRRNPDATWKDIAGITGELAKLTYCIHLHAAFNVYAEIEVAHDAVLTDPDAGVVREEQALAAYQRLARFITLGHSTTYNAIRTLQALVTTIVKNSPKTGNILWNDEEHRTSIQYEGKDIDLHQIRLSIEELTDGTDELYRTKILLNLPVRVEMDNLRDDISDTSNGFFFALHPQNTQCHDPKLLLHAVLADPTTRAKFCLGFDDRGQPLWNDEACIEWLTDYQEFQGRLITNATFCTGGAPRIPEISFNTFRNTSSSITRGLVLYGKHMLIIRRCLKQSALTGQDDLLPHPLSPPFADLHCQDLVVARPFAQVMAHVVFHSRDDYPEIRRMYHSSIFVNYASRFTADDVSPLLERYLCAHSEGKFGVRAFRHLTAAWLRHWGAVDIYDVERITQSAEADIIAQHSGHTARTDSRLYGISTSGLRSRPEEELPKYIEVGSTLR